MIKYNKFCIIQKIGSKLKALLYQYFGLFFKYQNNNILVYTSNPWKVLCKNMHWKYKYFENKNWPK